MASNTINVAPMLLLAIIIVFASTFADARNYEGGIQKPKNVVVKGSVFCDTQLSETAYFLPGALVAVECTINSNRKWKSSHTMVYIQGEANEDGEFTVELPIIQNLNPGKSCSARLLSSPHEFCDIPSIAASSQLTLTSSAPNGMHIYVSTPLSYRASKQEASFSSLPRRRALQDSTSSPPPLLGIPPLLKLTFPPLPNIPSLPKLSVPPFPSIPSFPKLSVPPLPSIPPLNIPNVVAPALPNVPTLPRLSVPPLSSVPTLPKLSVPPLPNTPPHLKLSVPPLPSVPTLPKLSVPPLPNTTPLPKLSVPPLPSVPTLPKLSVPPLPSTPPLPKLSVPPLPNAPPLNIPSIPPFPKLSFPPLPTFTSPFPPFPFFTPPPPS